MNSIALSRSFLNSLRCAVSVSKSFVTLSSISFWLFKNSDFVFSSMLLLVIAVISCLILFTVISASLSASANAFGLISFNVKFPLLISASVLAGCSCGI